MTWDGLGMYSVIVTHGRRYALLVVLVLVPGRLLFQLIERWGMA